MRNILSTVLKKCSKPFREVVKTLFKFSDIDLARKAKHVLIEEYVDQTKYQKTCRTLDEGFEDAFQYTSHNRLKSTNLLERLNEEVRRREKVIRIFSNTASANHLIGAVLMDIHENWISSPRKYIQFESSE